MRIGDLPRARKSAHPLSRPVFGALFVVLAIGSAVAGWQVLPDEEGQDTAQISPVAKQEQARAPQAAEIAPSLKKPFRVADANSGISYGSTLNSDTEASSAESPTRIPASTESHSAAAAHLPLATPDLRPAAPSNTPPAVMPEPEPAPAPAPSPAPAEVTGTVNTETASTQAALAPEPEQMSALVDLNTGSFEELNTLENGGPIGRAIIRGRPYASTEELVTKKVLRRSVYEQIKDQVTVQ